MPEGTGETATVERRLAAVAESLRSADAAWMRRLLVHPDAARIFGAIDGELFMAGDAGARTVAIVGAEREEGRTTFAVLIAVLAAAVDPSRRVLLVDADIERGRLGELFGVDAQAPGLGDLFEGAAKPEACIHATALPNLFVMPAFRAGRHVMTFNAPAFAALLGHARAQFGLVVADTAAASENKAVLALAKAAGTALLVVRYGGPTREQVARLVEDLRRAGAAIVGCVMNQRRLVVPSLFYGEH